MAMKESPNEDCIVVFLAEKFVQIVDEVVTVKEENDEGNTKKKSRSGRPQFGCDVGVRNCGLANSATSRDSAVVAWQEIWLRVFYFFLS